MPRDMGRTSKKGTLRESVYDSLKKMIQTGALQPGGRLRELDLAARLEVSRTPLREALNRLERDGLVTNKPRHGYFVTMFDLRTLEDAFDVREVLDGHAAQRAAERIGAEDKKRLRAIVRQCETMAKINNRPMEDLVEEMRLGFEIHRIIARVSGNDFLRELLSRIFDKFQHFVWIELLWLDEWDVARREHAAIVEAICSGDAERAAELARRHVHASRNNIVRFLQAKRAYQSFLARAS
ncbi:MAG TPA: GntR family transcriptional regulator [Alphaproteobacteria bacterium]|nr:GntR family transcriptional regulator [Alphaproteobacteria bacterium]